MTGIGAVAGNQVNSTTCAVTLPAGIVAVGDIMYAVLGHGTAGVVVSTVPAGWSVFSPIDSTQSMAGAVYTKTADAADVAGKVYTWVCATSGKYGVNITKVTGASGPGSIASVKYTTAAEDRLTPALVCADRSIEVGITKGTAPLTWDVYPPGFTNVQTVVQTGSGSILIDVATSTTDLDGGDSWSGSASQNQAIMYTISPTPSAAPPAGGTVIEMWTSGRKSDRVVVNTRLSGATSVRMAYSTNADMTASSYVAAQAPDSAGYTKHIVNGLSPETHYYFRAMDTPSGGAETAVGVIGEAWTRQVPGLPITGTRKMVLGGCHTKTSNDDTAWLDAIMWGAHWGVINGDLTYYGTENTDAASHRQKIEEQLERVPAIKTFVSKGLGSLYGRSDHDCGVTDNGDSNNAWTAANMVAYKQYFPYDVLNDPSITTTALDQIIDDGRFSFFLIDNRSTDRSPGGNTDSAAKTLLGAAQLARLLNWLATSPAKFKVILGDTAWMGAADIVNKQDWWPAYTFERQTIINAINARQAAGEWVEFWHGDSHLVGYATPAKNTWGNFPILCAAGFNQDGGGRNTSTFSAYWNNSGGPVREYGRITYSDDGTTMTRTFVGWDAAAGVARVTDTQTFTPPAVDDSAFFAFM